MDNEDRCFEEYLAGYVYGDGNLYYDWKKAELSYKALRLIYGNILSGVA